MKPTNEFVSIVYLSLLAATIVATVITKSALVLIGGFVGTAVVTRILVKGIF